MLSLREQAPVGDRTRRHDANHLAPYQAFCEGGILGLFTDSDLETRLHQPTEIYVRFMERHAAHGGAAPLAAVAPRQRQFKDAGRRDRVLEEHLIKVAETVKEDIIRVLVFDGKILLHHRGGIFEIRPFFQDVCHFVFPFLSEFRGGSAPGEKVGRKWPRRSVSAAVRMTGRAVMRTFRSGQSRTRRAGSPH